MGFLEVSEVVLQLETSIIIQDKILETSWFSLQFYFVLFLFLFLFLFLYFF